MIYKMIREHHEHEERFRVVRERHFVMPVLEKRICFEKCLRM